MVKKLADKILFVCDCNASRSQMAEAICRHEIGGDMDVISAGISAAPFVNPFVVKLMKDAYGENLMDVSPRTLSDVEDLREVSLFTALSDNAFDVLRDMKEKDDISGEVEFWDVPSPPDENQRRELIIDAYKILHDDIKAHINNRFASIMGNDDEI